MSKKDALIVGLDIGTTKICCTVGEVTESGVDIIGIGCRPSKGLRKGVVINIDATVSAIREAVHEAETMAACEIREVYAGIAGGHILGFNSQGVVAVKDNKEVSRADIGRVLDAARAVNIPQDRMVLHVLPQEFKVDEQEGVREPRGMMGVRLEASVHIVTAAISSAQNIVKCAEKAGLEVIEVVLQPLASAQATVADEERELGVALIDIGGGTTDIAVFQGGSIRHTSVVTLGGNHITSDIAVGLRTPMQEAERIKQRYGCALASLIDKDEAVEVPSVGGRQPRTLARQIICEIIEPRVEELFKVVQHEIARTPALDGEALASGVVLTGGTTQLAGIVEVAEDVLGVPVRRGLPRGIGGLVDLVRSPQYATAVGLVLYGTAQRALPPGQGAFRRGHPMRAIVDWFKNLF